MLHVKEGDHFLTSAQIFGRESRPVLVDCLPSHPCPIKQGAPVLFRVCVYFPNSVVLHCIQQQCGQLPSPFTVVAPAPTCPSAIGFLYQRWLMSSTSTIDIDIRRPDHHFPRSFSARSLALIAGASWTSASLASHWILPGAGFAPFPVYCSAVPTSAAIDSTHLPTPLPFRATN